jgi:hypothetical protein
MGHIWAIFSQSHLVTLPAAMIRLNTMPVHTYICFDAGAYSRLNGGTLGTLRFPDFEFDFLLRNINPSV